LKLFFRKFKIWYFLPIFVKIRTREPGPVLGNLYVLILFIVDPYLGTWTRTREPGPVLGNLDPYSGTSRTCLCTQVPEYGTHKKTPHIWVFYNKCLNSYFYSNHWCLAILPCPMGYRFWIWTQKDWFYPEILCREVGPILVTHTVHSNSFLHKFFCIFSFGGCGGQGWFF
jgi:hypothetical protein